MAPEAIGEKEHGESKVKASSCSVRTARSAPSGVLAPSSDARSY